MSIKGIVLFLLIFYQCCNQYTNGQDIPFTKIVLPKEFWNSLTTGIIQDKLGYMWFTSGTVLYRYDGYKFTPFTHDPANLNSLSKARLTTLYADRTGYIWIGTDGSGLDKFDPKKGTFVHYRSNRYNQFSIICDTIRTVLEDKNGNIWVGTKGGLSKYDTTTQKFTNFKSILNDPRSLSHNHVRSLFEDRAGIIWIATGSAFINDGTNAGEGGLNRFEATSQTFTRYLHDPEDIHTLADNRVEAIYEDKKGVFWIGTASDGLHTLNRNNGKFTRHVFDPRDPTKLSRPALKESVTCGADDHILFIKEDSTGDIWIGTLAGVSRYNPSKGSVSLITSFGEDSLFDVSATVMYTSRDGVVWLGTWSDNLYTIDPLRKPIPHVSVNSSVWSVFEDRNEDLWIGTSDGIVVMNKNKKVKNLFGYDSLAIEYTDASHVIGINQDSKGTIWVGTTSGLARYNRVTQNFTHFKNELKDNTSISKGVVFTAYEDSQGIMWVCTFGGLDMMNVSEGTFKHLRHDSKDTNSLSNNFVNGILEDSRGNMWITNWNGGGLNMLDRSSERFRHFLQGFSISCIFEDTDGILWVGTEADGLYKYNSSDGTFSRYTDPGSFITNHIIVDIVEDDLKNLWVASLSGIVSLNRQRDQSVYHGMKNGIDCKNLRYGAGYRLKSGQLIFGDASGFYSFFPAEMHSNRIPPQLAISDFKYFNESQEPVADSSINVNLERLKEVRLKYNQNSFALSFAALHFSSSPDNQHFYMLEGYDLKWQKAGSKLKAEYFNMAPATYVFHVKAANSDGIWASQSIKIIISPAWWNTWWFKIIALATMFVMFYLIVRWRMHLRFQSKINQSEREKELAELRHKAAELEMSALRSQMNPHFIFNSLNSINRFILENNRSQASEYLTKFSRLMRLIMQNSAHDLIELEKEIEALRLYLELEAARFDNHFSYNIKIDDDIDPETLKVPPLIIQPYAENAIWHGLMHKKEKGFLHIELIEQNEFLVYRITDDGIGRQKAASLKSKYVTGHQSMGMKITADRIAIMKDQNVNENPILITDLVLPDGQAAGTCVEIKLPIHYD